MYPLNYFKTKLLFSLFLFFVFCAFPGVSFAAKYNEYKMAQINYGKYLVKDVGKCADCHTPKDMHGRSILSQWLKGAPIDLKPVHPIPGWVNKAPDIAGLPKGWTQMQMVKFLQTGINPKNTYARPPMPAYRLSAKDALAVTVYLKSLRH
jgi:mono/diheme cytochrome c family protein